jgi:zinc D-Ala-D-Ala carboxypeptidase
VKSPLIAIDILSIYKDKLGALIPLPSAMAKCTPDTHLAISNIAADLVNAGGKLILSDLFRNHDMQAQSHQDYISGKKKHSVLRPAVVFTKQEEHLTLIYAL